MSIEALRGFLFTNQCLDRHQSSQIFRPWRHKQSAPSSLQSHGTTAATGNASSSALTAPARYVHFQLSQKACAQHQQIWDGHETAFTLAASFDWKVLNSPVLDEQPAITGGRTAKTLAHLSMEITLTERRCPCPEGWNFDENILERIRMTSSTFKDSAFQSKTFSVRLESGRFAKPFMEDHGGVKEFGDQAHSYALRLVFDRCPWPTPEEHINGSSSIWWYQRKMTRFVCRESGLYNSWMGSCIVV